MIVSRDDFEKIKPNLRNYLLTAGYTQDADDAFDAALRTVRERAPVLRRAHATDPV